MTPAWLLLAVDQALPELLGADRDRLAARVLEHIPAGAIVAAIADSAAAVLRTRNVADATGALARELGRNSAQTVLFALTVEGA